MLVSACALEALTDTATVATQTATMLFSKMEFINILLLVFEVAVIT